MTIQSLVNYHTVAAKRLRRAEELAKDRYYLSETEDERKRNAEAAERKRKLALMHERFVRDINELNGRRR